MATQQVPQGARLLAALRAFESAARLTSFKLAAERLGVTEGAISRHIRNLETELGTLLFTRAHNRVRLTEDGYEFSRAIMPAFDMIDDAIRSISDRSARATVVLGAPATFLLRWLIPRLPQLESKLGGVPIRLATWDKPADPHRDDIDLFIGVGRPPRGSDVDVVRLMPEKFGLVVNPRNIMPGQDLSHQMRNLCCLVPKTRPNIITEWIDEMGTEIQFGSSQQFERLFYALQACESGHGATVAPVPLVEDALRDGRLVAPFGFVERTGFFFAALPVRRKRTSLMANVTQWLVDEFAKTSQLEI